MKALYRRSIIAALLLNTLPAVEQTPVAGPFILNPDRRFAYLQFDHYGVWRLPGNLHTGYGCVS